MKKSETKKFEELSEEVLGHKYHYKKLMVTGIVYDRQRVNPTSNGRPAFVARRRPLTSAGVWEYMMQTKQMQAKIKQDLEEKNNAKG